MAGRPLVNLDADTQEFVALAGHLRGLDANVHKAFAKRIRGAVKPTVKSVRTEVLKTPSKRRLKSGKDHRAARSYGMRGRLRQEIAAGLRVDYTDRPSTRFVGVRIRATSAGLSPDRKGMQRTYNQRTFRRRVFGTDTWVEQAGRPYFDEPIRRDLPRIRRELDGFIDDAKSASGFR